MPRDFIPTNLFSITWVPMPIPCLPATELHLVKMSVSSIFSSSMAIGTPFCHSTVT